MKRYFACFLALVCLLGLTACGDKDARETEPSVVPAPPTNLQYVAKVRMSGLYGLIDESGKLILPCEYDRIGNAFHDGRISLKDAEGKWGFANGSGTVVVAPQYEDVYDFSNGLAGVQENGKWGYIDREGNMVIEPQFQSAYEFIPVL